MRKIFNTLLLLTLSCVTAMAIGKNEVTIKSFKVIPGQETEVEVTMDNEDNISALQFDVYFPEGLSFVEGSLTPDADRFPSKRTHLWDYRKRDDLAQGAVRFAVVPRTTDPAKSNIYGNTGTIVRFKVKATGDFKDGIIKMNNIIGSDATGSDGHAVEIDMPSQTVSVYSNVGTFTPEAEQLVVNSDESSVLPQIRN